MIRVIVVHGANLMANLDCLAMVGGPGRVITTVHLYIADGCTGLRGSCHRHLLQVDQMHLDFQSE